VGEPGTRRIPVSIPATPPDDRGQYTELVEFLGLKFDAIDRRFDAIERRLTALGVSFDRFEVDFGTVVLHQGRRIRALEGPENG